MNELVQDTWEDLRERRLWPIVLVLVLALIAIPFLLTRSAETPLPGAPPAVAPPVADERTAVKLDDDGGAAASGTGSSLERFAESDPFTPPAAIARAGRSATAQATVASTVDSAQGGGGGGGSDSSPPSTDRGRPAPVVPPQVRTKTSEYEYVADVTFWNGERRRALRGLRKLDMLPNQSAPVLIFMGTSGNGGNAVFLVDSTLAARGEGQCVPNPENCAYVHVGPGAEHLFTTEEGDAYRLRVEEIRRVKVKASVSSSATAVAGKTAATATRRFQLPSLIDLIAVTETTTTTTAPSSQSGADPAPQNGSDRSSNAGQGR